jgi:hypothetical protein
MKEELNKNMESIKGKKKNQTETLEIKGSLSQILKVQLKANPADWNKWKTEFQDSETK